jgi:hypothetical protein
VLLCSNDLSSVLVGWFNNIQILPPTSINFKVTIARWHCLARVQVFERLLERKSARSQSRLKIEMWIDGRPSSRFSVEIRVVRSFDFCDFISGQYASI